VYEKSGMLSGDEIDLVQLWSGYSKMITVKGIRGVGGGGR